MMTVSCRIYIYTAVEVEETIEDMLRRYKIAINDKDSKVQLMKKLLDEYKDGKAQLFLNIQQACSASKRLEEISLGKCSLSSVEYIERLIASEEKSNRPNKANRIEQLRHFR
jgi:hypothetical protein